MNVPAAPPPGAVPPELNLTRLRAFLVVAEELSFTRAAARLHVAQQALSATIRRLEGDVGARLFERSTRAVALTPAGQALLRRARPALEQLGRGVAEARRADRQLRGALCVGVMAGAALELTEPLLAEVARQLPGVTVRLAPHLYDDPSAGLRDGSSDVALLRPPLELRGLETAPLFSEPRWAAMSARHPLARRRSLSLAELRGATVVRPASPDPIWNDFWAAGSVTTIDARTLEAALELVSAGRAIAVSAAGWARFYPRPGVRTLSVDELTRSEVAVGWRKGDRAPLVRRFIEIALATVRRHPKVVAAIERPRRPRAPRTSRR
jgi:DNA-binding transcriptional LysR family regulator